MKFLVDAQLPPALAVALTFHGHSTETVRNCGLRDSDDAEIWDFAEANQWAIITKDEDFAQRAQRSFTGPVVVWLRIGNCSNQALCDWLIPLFGQVVECLERGDRLVEVR